MNDEIFGILRLMLINENEKCIWIKTYGDCERELVIIIRRERGKEKMNFIQSYPPLSFIFIFEVL